MRRFGNVVSTYGVKAAAASDGMTLGGAGLASGPDSHYVTTRTLRFKSFIEFCGVQFVVSVSVHWIVDCLFNLLDFMHDENEHVEWITCIATNKIFISKNTCHELDQ